MDRLADLLFGAPDVGLAMRQAIRKARPPKDKPRPFRDRSRYTGQVLRAIRHGGGGAKEQARAAKRAGLGVALVTSKTRPGIGSELIWGGNKGRILVARAVGVARFQVVFDALPTGETP